MIANRGKRSVVVLASLMSVGMASLAHPVLAADDKWKEDMIADALLAAPPAVTQNARIYAWNAKGQFTLVREGAGPYTCVASGAFSLRIGKPPLPYPDPMCMDANGWAFLHAVWTEKDPLHPSNPYPTAPGLVWMLAGMNVKKGEVAVGSSQVSVMKITEGTPTGDVVQMSPHVMIMPVPFNKRAAKIETKYDVANPLNAWIMAAGTPYEHLMLHFSSDDVRAMMEGGK